MFAALALATPAAAAPAPFNTASPSSVAPLSPTSQSLLGEDDPLVLSDYAIPGGARFVATNGNDNNSGTQGSPWRTIAKAVRSAPDGGTIVIRGGTYRESVEFGGKRLTLQPYPNEHVWMDGTVEVTGWVPEGRIWRKDNWNYQFRRGGLSSAFTDPAYPLSSYPDMVFVDGQSLRQVGSKDRVTDGTFFVDYSTRKLYIGTNPSGKRVEGTALSQAFVLNGGAQGSVIRGLGFRRYASHRNDFGMVKSSAPNVTFERNTFAWSAATGLGVFDRDSVVRGNTFINNGILGLTAQGAHKLLAERNAFIRNNQEHFALQHEAGGSKVSSSYHTVFRFNLAEQNIGKGLWWDVHTYNTTIIGNEFRNNQHRGLAYEISAKAIIASNLFVNHSNPESYALFVNESHDIAAYNNTFSNNHVSIGVVEGDRYRSHPVTLDNGQQVTINENVSDVTLKNNLVSYDAGRANDSFLVSIRDWTKRRSADQMMAAMNANGYYRASAGAPDTAVRWGRGGGQNPVMFDSVVQFRNSTGREQQALVIDNQGTNPFFVDAGRGNYRLKAGSPAHGRGEPLPQAVASAIGVPAGVPVDLGALVWRD